MKVRNILFNILIVIFSLLLLGFVVRGDKGNPVYFQSEKDTRVGGPFESSNSTSRYALTETIIKKRTFYLDEKLARFSAPDVVYHNNVFFSIFTPGISFIGIPFYILGSYFGMPQLFTYFSVSIFLVVNIFLITSIAKRIGADNYSSILGGLIFAFSTNALNYALSLTQHLTSTAIVLLAILSAGWRRNLLTNIFFGALCGIGALVDIPNLFLLAPVGVYIVFKNFSVQTIATKIKLIIKPSLVGILIGIVPFIILFAHYNLKTSGSTTLLAQSIGQSNFFDSAEKKAEKLKRSEKDDKKEKKSFLPFKTRNQLQGLYIFGYSDERSWLYYSPVVLFGIAGLYFGFKKKKNKPLLALCVTTALLNFVLYSMFGDPWGGWSFGPRYLIPSAAILSVGISVLIQRFKRRIILLVPFFLILVYSIYITFLGALTTNAIPPKQEALALSSPIPYTYEYNSNLVKLNKSSSLFYNLLLKGKMDLWIYHVILVSATSGFLFWLLLLSLLAKNNDE